MRIFAVIVWLFCLQVSAQNKYKYAPDENTLLGSMQDGDSLVYYQCHVEFIEQAIRTAEGQELPKARTKATLTEKFVLKKQEGKYWCSYFIASYTGCPNRRFTGLKFSEKSYWQFSFQHKEELDDQQLQFLQVVEYAGKDATEYDLIVNERNSNQVLILKGKRFRQIGLAEKTLLAKLFKPREQRLNLDSGQ